MKKKLRFEYNTKTKEELQALAEKEIQELIKSKLYQSVKKTKNTRENFMRRKTIAVLKTYIRQKEISHG